jgi:hypothetical protein
VTLHEAPSARGAQRFARERSPSAAPRARSGDRTALLAVAALAVAALAVLLYAGRGIGFYYDEWNFVLDRQGRSLDVLLKPHNEHISLVPVALYKLMFETVGLDQHWPYRALLGLLHVGCGLATYVLARRRIGAWPALLPAALVLFLGLAHDNQLFAFQIGFVGSVLGGLLAWVALDRTDGRGAALACVALTFAISSSSLGVPLALGVAVELLLGGRRRALWVAGVPLVLYAAWYLGYGASTITAEGVVHMVPWAAGAATAAAGAVVGLGPSYGTVIAVGFVVAVGWRLAVGDASPRLVGLVTTGVAFWLLTGAARSVFQPPVPAESSRYLTLGAVVFVLLAVELLRRLPGRMEARPAFVAYAAAIALAVIAMGYASLHDYGKQIRGITDVTAVELGGLELVATYAAPDYQPDPPNMPQVSAARYLNAVDVYGSSPASTPAEIATADEAARVQADRVVVQFGLEVVAAGDPRPSAGAAPAVEQAAGGAVQARGSCLAFRPAAAGATLAVTLPATGVIVRATGPAPIELAARRFASGFGATIASASPGKPLRLVPRRDAAAGSPYRVRATGAGPMQLCAA